MNILVVDDCSTTRKLIEHYLRSGGYSAVNAENGLDALEKLAVSTVDLVITDLNMPHMDGIELIRSIRSNPDLSEIPILMITTESDDKEKAAALGSGANGYVVKPVTGEAIIENIKSIVNQKAAKGG